ncbi:MAG: hypothetical protein CVT49_01950 [candidate division Zixibacteria bacterium HGW-Zixibacteria-1]|nr:MAG: hypothetical protein CVT49_01950 [candidate division Zixibacteria bacterium HGW-Zixibacteria-1]
MFKKLIPVFIALFAITVAASAFGQTEDEIISKYLKKMEKDRKHKIYYGSLSFSYGKLPNSSDYNVYSNYVNVNVGPDNPMTGIWRSKELSANMGMMISKKTSFQLGFDYWLKMGDNRNGDYTFSISPLGTQTDFELISEVQVYGITGGVDYHLLNPPDNEGIVNGFNVRVGGGGGIYFSKWEVWSGASSFNLSTSDEEANVAPLKGTSPGFSAWVGADYPTGFFGMLLSANVNYLYLNFSDVHSYNDFDEELYLSYTSNPEDRVELDFSGLRGKIEFKKYFKW